MERVGDVGGVGSRYPIVTLILILIFCLCLVLVGVLCGHRLEGTPVYLIVGVNGDGWDY